VGKQHKLLICGQSDSRCGPLIEQLQSEYEISIPESLPKIMQVLQEQEIAGVFLWNPDKTFLLESAGILDQIPDGLVILNTDLEIIWANKRLLEIVGRPDVPVHTSFYEAFGTPEIIGPDYCPLHSAFGTGEAAQSMLHVGEKCYYQVHAQPMKQPDEDKHTAPEFLVVTVRDISLEVMQQQKLNSIYQAGLELGDLSPQEVLEMSVEERVELLKCKILHYTQDLLQFETVEVRLLDKETNILEVLLAEGMDADAENRELYARPEDNGVTGFVAATGKSYLCEDTTSDPLYLQGATGARSSLTVPLILHEEILGSFNVESEQLGAFDENDLRFLELFSREVAVALNTLDLLVAEQMTTATASTENILKEVANPVDQILSDAAWILERYIGHEPNVCERLQKILKNTRDIKQQIYKVGETMAPRAISSAIPQKPRNPNLAQKRVLVVDSDRTVRRAAHELLGRAGCEVETAHDGEQAMLMVRSFHYDVVLADIRLPDMNGYECFTRLRAINEHLPIILMTGFGYDATHSIVKARQHGLKSVLYKPFRLDQLIQEVEKAVTVNADVAAGI